MLAQIVFFNERAGPDFFDESFFESQFPCLLDEQDQDLNRFRGKIYGTTVLVQALFGAIQAKSAEPSRSSLQHF